MGLLHSGSAICRSACYRVDTIRNWIQEALREFYRRRLDGKIRYFLDYSELVSRNVYHAYCPDHWALEL